jgi:hypothetical protein
MKLELAKIIGLKVVAIKAEKEGKEVAYILFDDGKTYLHLIEQDMNYHDCSLSARLVNLRFDEEIWKFIMEVHPDAVYDL